MLTALLLAGLVTAVATPVYVMTTQVDEEDPSDLESSRNPDGVETVLDAVTEGAAFDVPAQPGQVTLADFTPGTDTLRLHVASYATEFMVLEDPSGGVSLHYNVMGQAAEIRFPGLDTLPDSDIRIFYPDSVKQAGALIEVYAGLSVQDMVDPGDPDADAYARWDVDQIAPVTNAEPDDRMPVVEEAIDMVHGPKGVLELPDFIPGQHVVKLTLTTDQPPDTVSVSIATSFDGEDGLLIANGKLIAVFPGFPDAQLEDMQIDVVHAKAA